TKRARKPLGRTAIASATWTRLRFVRCVSALPCGSNGPVRLLLGLARPRLAQPRQFAPAERLPRIDFVLVFLPPHRVSPFEEKRDNNPERNQRDTPIESRHRNQAPVGSRILRNDLVLEQESTRLMEQHHHGT